MALIQLYTPVLHLLARDASGDLDAVTRQIADRLRHHLPALIDTHYAIVSRLSPDQRALATNDLVDDLRSMAAMAQSRLNLIAERRRGGCTELSSLRATV